MVQRLLAILLICSLFAETGSRLLITAAFELNQSYIATYFCINKDKPMLHCDGKCYLARKLKEAEENEKKSEKESVKVSSYQVAFLSERTTLTAPILPPVEERKVGEFSFSLPTRPTTIFHPPRA